MPTQTDLDQFKLRAAQAIVATFDMARIRQKSLANLDRWNAQGVWCSAHDEWRSLMTSGSDADIIAVMTGENEYANRLRQSPPYSGLLDVLTVAQLRETPSDGTERMKLFLDTEFTDYIECELISIGIVSEDGREFYAERNDVDLSRCSPFVKEAVLPLLGREPAIVGTKVQLSDALKAWLAQFDDVEVCVDYSTDFELFSYLVRDLDTLTIPARIKGLNINNKIAAVDIEHYWQENRRMMHHALHGARANRFAFMSIRKE